MSTVMMIVIVWLVASLLLAVFWVLFALFVRRHQPSPPPAPRSPQRRTAPEPPPRPNRPRLPRQRGKRA